jgi:uncharacterized protein YecE (DUF72 family)
MAGKPRSVPNSGETLSLFEPAKKTADLKKTTRPFGAPDLRVGTSAFTAAGWEHAFYPAGMKPADYLTYYATQFDTVEIDSTFYRTPPAATVNSWREKTPRDFLFGAKVPQIITHKKVLLDCEKEFDEFVGRMGLLHEKLGPLLLQFPYFNKKVFKSGGEFNARLQQFLKRTKGMSCRFAVEIRNRNWLEARFAALLSEFDVALALQDQSWMPRPKELFDRFDPITADFTYIRWLGDRKAIEERTKTWDKTIIDRREELSEWVDILRKVRKRKIQILAFANNHYAGFGPATAEMFLKLWNDKKLSHKHI